LGLLLLASAELFSGLFDDTQGNEIVDQSGNSGQAYGEEKF